MKPALGAFSRGTRCVAVLGMVTVDTLKKICYKLSTPRVLNRTSKKAAMGNGARDFTL